jgi:hypothetical protein
MRARRLLFAFALVSFVAGCRSTFTSQVAQPELVLGATDEARTSLPLEIVTRDMEFPRGVKLANTAYFVAVSRDRIKFHVELQHKWDTMCDLREWSVVVEDGWGRHHVPETIDQRRVHPITLTPADTHYVGWNGHYFTGKADISIYRRELIRAATNRVTLILRRPGYEYRYVWRFVDEDEDATSSLRLPSPSSSSCPWPSTACVAPWPSASSSSM